MHFFTQLFSSFITACHHTTAHHNHFTALFPGPPRWASARRELLDFMVQGKINRGRHTDHPTGRRSIRTNQCPLPPSPIFLQAGCPSCRPTNSLKALKAILQHANTILTTVIISSIPGLSLNSLHVNLSVTLMPTHPSSDCHHSTLKCQLVLTLWPYFTANHTHNFSSSSETNTSALLNYESWQDSTELKYATCWQSSVPDGLSTVFLQFIILQVLSAVISHRTLLYASAPLVNIQNCSCPSDCSMGWLTQ